MKEVIAIMPHWFSLSKLEMKKIKPGRERFLKDKRGGGLQLKSGSLSVISGTSRLVQRIVFFFVQHIQLSSVCTVWTASSKSVNCFCCFFVFLMHTNVKLHQVNNCTVAHSHMTQTQVPSFACVTAHHRANRSALFQLSRLHADI